MRHRRKLIYPPTHHSAVPSESYNEPADEWRLIAADLDEIAPATPRVLGAYVDGATVDEIGTT